MDSMTHLMMGGHIGSSDLLQMVKKNRPRLVISGHVHESPGVMRSDGIVFVNPGPAYQDRCVLLTISENGDIEAHTISG